MDTRQALVLPIMPDMGLARPGQPRFVFDEADRVAADKRQRDRTIEDMDKARRYPDLYGQWMAGGWRWHGKKCSTETQRSYARAVEVFTTFALEQLDNLSYRDQDGILRVAMWRVHGQDVVRWQNVMRAAELSETTINLRLAGLSSLFKFLKRQEYVHPITGEMTYFCLSNPCETPIRTKIDPFKSDSATYISFDEFQALLRRIDRSRLEGLRDYALILSLFLTGQRSHAIASLRWGDIEHPKSDSTPIFYTWESKAKNGRDELLRPAYDAILAYLKAAGRLDRMSKDDYVFQPLSDVGVRMAERKAELAGRTIRTRGENHLSGARVNRIVKHAAKRAGLAEERIHTHITRHSFAIWMSENNVGIEEIQRTLHHSSPATTAIYLKAMKRDRHPMWAKIGSFFEGV